MISVFPCARYCHKHYIRQFNGMEKVAGKASFTSKDPDDDTQYLLGYYNISMDPLSEPEEWKRIVNKTSDALLEGWHASVAHGGNGAYFELEYTNGEMCVLESQSAGELATMERASTVRLSCASALTVSVHEDNTCHYIVEVKIPYLCQHPLFKAALTRRRVMKCLRVD
jgi:Glucosidase II beta subunit-like protein